MPQGKKVLRYQLSKDAASGEQMRDMQGALDTIPFMFLRTVDTAYTEPLVIGNLRSKPAGIEALDVIDLSAPELPVLGGSRCCFVWKPQLGGAVITSIDGMSVAANGGKQYRITFRITYKAG